MAIPSLHILFKENKLRFELFQHPIFVNLAVDYKKKERNEGQSSTFRISRQNASARTLVGRHRFQTYYYYLFFFLYFGRWWSE